MDDVALVQRIVIHNDHRAFSDLMEKYQKMVVSTCRGFVMSYADAEDIAQDVFVELYQSLPAFRNESKLSTWIYRISVNKSLNFVKRKKRESLLNNLSFWGRESKTENPVHTDSIMGAADQNMMYTETKKILKDAIGKLPENQRVALILSKYQELSYKEIAEVMNVSVSSVESLLFRAKTNLRKYLVSDDLKKNER